MNKKTQELTQTIAGWLRMNHFTFYDADTADGKMLVTRFTKLEGYEFEIDFSINEEGYEVCAFLQTHAPQQRREELSMLLAMTRERKVSAEIDPDGNLSFRPLACSSSVDQISPCFWLVFSTARTFAPAVRSILTEGTNAEEAWKKSEEIEKNAGWDLNPSRSEIPRQRRC